MVSKVMITIPWYMQDKRFEPGTVADIGGIRLILKRTQRKKNNKWTLFMCMRTFKTDGVTDDLTRELHVATFDGHMSLSEAQCKANEYFKNFITGLVVDAEDTL